MYVSFSRARKDRLQARMRVSAQTGQREWMHARRRKRCDEPFTKRRWLGQIFAASLAREAVAGLFGVDACETSRHGQWLPTTRSEWRGEPAPSCHRSSSSSSKDQAAARTTRYYDSATVGTVQYSTLSRTSSPSAG